MHKDIRNLLIPDLVSVQRPGRYLGNEWNVTKKDLGRAELRCALCFPDFYEVGMSHLGLRVLYGLLNSQEAVACERAFAVSADFEALLNKRGLPLFSLESAVPLADFDVLGFCLSYDLHYTNVLQMLSLARIPLWSRERLLTDSPLVIAGGNCSLNPEPLAEFIDLFFVGEAEEGLLEIVDVLLDLRRRGVDIRRDKPAVLRELMKVAGVYVPGLYEARYGKDGCLASFTPTSPEAPSRVRRRIVEDLDSCYYPLTWMVPWVKVIHDRIALEIARGCPHRCRFCQAQSFYYPYRRRSFKKILSWAGQLLSNTGYEQISLLSLSSADYPELGLLLSSLLNSCQGQGVSVSLPSLHAGSILKELIPRLTQLKKTGLTFAPEAATERLRAILGKPLNRGFLEEALLSAFRAGYNKVKLYFMIGLPMEQKEDLDAILRLAQEFSLLKKEIDNRPASITLSIATLIPKPHTAFQWLAFERLEVIKRKHRYLKEKLREIKKVPLTLKFHNPYMSELEALFCRGDRRLSRVIFLAWQKGARFDAWSEHFRYSLWQEAFVQAGIDPDFYLYHQRNFQELLPWDFIDMGQDKKELYAQSGY